MKQRGTIHRTQRQLEVRWSEPRGWPPQICPCCGPPETQEWPSWSCRSAHLSLTRLDNPSFIHGFRWCNEMQWTYIPRHNWSTSQPTTSPARPAFLQQPQHQALLSRAGVARQPGMLRCAERCVGGGVPRGMARQARQATGELGKHLAEPMGTWSRHVPAWSGERWVRNLHITIKRISATNVKILIYEMGLHFWFSVICSEGHYYQLCWWQGTSVSTLALFWGWKICCDYWLLWTTKLWLYFLRVKNRHFVATFFSLWDLFAAVDVVSPPAQPLLAAQTLGAWRYKTRLPRVTDLEFSF